MHIRDLKPPTIRRSSHRALALYAWTLIESIHPSLFPPSLYPYQDVAMSDGYIYPETVIPLSELASQEPELSVLANGPGELQVEIEIDHTPETSQELAEIRSFIGINSIEGTSDVALTFLSGDDSVHLQLNRHEGSRLSAALDLYQKWARTEDRYRSIDSDQEADSC